MLLPTVKQMLLPTIKRFLPRYACQTVAKFNSNLYHLILTKIIGYDKYYPYKKKSIRYFFISVQYFHQTHLIIAKLRFGFFSIIGSIFSSNPFDDSKIPIRFFSLVTVFFHSIPKKNLFGIRGG